MQSNNLDINELPFAVIKIDLDFNIIATNNYFNRHVDELYSNQFLVGRNVIIANSVSNSLADRIVAAARQNCDQTLLWTEEPHPLPMVSPSVSNPCPMFLNTNILLVNDSIIIMIIDATNEAHATHEHERIQKKLLNETHRDPLTNLYNRRYILQQIEKHKRLANRKQNDVFYGLLSIDIDNFKSINDTYGHTVGDEVLKWFSSLLLDTFRNTDIVCRMGGEEFLVFFPEPEDSPNVEAGCTRLLTKLNSELFQFDSLHFPVTASLGGLSVRTKEPTTNAITFSDKLLYDAKNNGRNQAVIAQLYGSLPNVNFVGPPFKEIFKLNTIKPSLNCSVHSKIVGHKS